MLQTLGSDETYRSGEPSLNIGYQQGLNLSYYLDILKRRFFYFLGIFGLISTLGLCLAIIWKPLYLSEGKILVQSPEIAPDIVAPVVTATASERAQLIQQRVMTRDHLLSIASKFGLFPRASDSSEILDLMRKRLQIKPVPVEIDGQFRPNSRSAAFTVGFQHESPELAMKVANEFVTLIVSGDERSRSSRATEMVKLLTSQTKDIEDKLEATQMQVLEAERRPHDTTADVPEEQRSQLAALAALKAELIQKTSVYSDGHPAVIALKKRIAAMEKSLAQPTLQAAAGDQSTPSDDLGALKRQREALEKRLADATGKLASARLSEKLEQQSERMQVIEAPPLPEKPEKSKRILIVGFGFVAAAILGVGAAIGRELLDGSIRSRNQLTAVIPGSLIVCIPYIATRADVIRARLRVLFGILSVVMLLAVWFTLLAAIVFHPPVDFVSFYRSATGLYAPNR